MNIEEISNTALVIAMLIYCIAFVMFVLSIAGKRWSHRDPVEHTKRWGQRSFTVAILGLVSHLVFFFTRWYYGGHIPTSNMFEFMTFLSMMIAIAFVVIYLLYKTPVLGAFTMPVIFVLLAYASVFPWEVQPLIPALNSYWLKIHVTTAATGEAFLAVGFAAGLMYLIRTIDFSGATKQARRARTSIEFTLMVLLFVIGFVLVVFSFNGAGYSANFVHEQIVITDGQEQLVSNEIEYVLPPIVKPYQSKTIQMDSFLGMNAPLFEAPSWMDGVKAGRKLNTVIWSIITGFILYGLLRLIFRKRLGEAIKPIMNGIDPDDLDEISYRAIAIGFPIFTLGALVFAMIWANVAWSRFWGWDPKEVWALITWLYYSAYLHLRLSKGWQGHRSAWLSVIGFLIIMFTLIGVNLIVAGLHSYAGV